MCHAIFLFAAAFDVLLPSSMKYEHFLSCLGGGGVLWHNESPDCYSKRTTSTMADMARPVDSIAEPAVPTPKRCSNFTFHNCL